jgi:hypothetical protein
MPWSNLYADILAISTALMCFAIRKGNPLRMSYSIEIYGQTSWH